MGKGQDEERGNNITEERKWNTNKDKDKEQREGKEERRGEGEGRERERIVFFFFCLSNKGYLIHIFHSKYTIHTL